MKTIKSVSTLMFALSVSMAAGLASAAEPVAKRAEIVNHGAVVQDAGAVRKIVIQPNTKSVTVQDGETVTFVVDGKTFSYHFQTWPTTNVLPLSAIAPQEVNVGGVRVYVNHLIPG